MDKKPESDKKPNKQLNKTVRLVIISVVIAILFLSQFSNIKLLILYYSPIHTVINPWLTSSTPQQINNALSHLDTKDAKLQNEESYEGIKNYKANESVFYKSDILSVYKFYDDQKGDFFQAGGCTLTRDEYYYKIDDKYYLLDLANTYQLRKPKDVNGYLELVRIYEYFNTGFCGHESILTTSSYMFYPTEYKYFGCDPALKDVRVRLETQNGKLEFVYYRFSLEEPAALYEHRISYVNGKLEDNVNTVYECSGHGIQY